MIKFVNVSKFYADRLILNKINLSIKKGELLVIIGPSGSGKTTLIKLINGLITPDKGSVLINGKSLTSNDFSNLRLNMGYVPQKESLFPHLTIEENISIQLKEQNYSSNYIKNKITDALRAVHLDNQISKCYPHELSGGQRQRAVIARAIINNPKIIIFDESFSALDPVLRIQLQNLILSLHKKYTETTMIFITHDMQEAKRMSDRVLFLANGKIQQLGTFTDLLNNPSSHLISKFLKNNNPKEKMQLFLEHYAQRINPSNNSIHVTNISDIIECLFKIQSEYLKITYQKNNYLIKRQQLLAFIREELD